MRTTWTFVLSLVAITIVQGSPLKSRLRLNTPENIARLHNPQPGDLAEELSGQFEGDIVLTEAQEDAIVKGKRNGLIDVVNRWPNNVVPYEIVEEHFTPEQVAYIELGLRTLEQRSCLRFRRRQPEDGESYVRVFGNDSGCWSWVGYQGDEYQELHLTPNELEVGCFRLATIMHEFLHALGFYHQQSASDRDQFVDILMENVQEGTQNNFYIYPADVVTDFGVRYDYGSVMHYGPFAFSKNGLPTIVPKDPKAEIGQRVRLSESDISKLNHMYGCLKKN
uniref:Metalloendopeptidase n=1 Tax=Culex tarsalis TaxID=7177 RepID=A0A1Q3FQ05_CULTA